MPGEADKNHVALKSQQPVSEQRLQLQTSKMTATHSTTVSFQPE
jgi:hypothetical protein